MKTKENTGLVYSTEHGSMCPACGRPKSNCSCTGGIPVKNDGIVRLCRETKGRKGKGMTIITGIPLGRKELNALAKKLKKKLGTGGTVKDGTIEIQGDHRDILAVELAGLGWTVKKAGG